MVSYVIYNTRFFNIVVLIILTLFSFLYCKYGLKTLKKVVDFRLEIHHFFVKSRFSNLQADVLMSVAIWNGLKRLVIRKR